MTNTAPAIVQNADGLIGVLEHPDSVHAKSEARIAVRLTSGRVVLVPVDLMVIQADGSYHLDLSAAEVDRLEAENSTTTDESVEDFETDGLVVVPVVAESVEVEKRSVEKGRVRVRKAVKTVDQTVTDSLHHEEVEVERVAINRVITEPVGNRQEGDTLVIPVLKEVLVVEKRLMLVEEIRITRRKTEQPFAQTVTLRTETVIVERSGAAVGEAVKGSTRKQP